ncbi:MAG: biotin-dependent carboxyltransferase family protein [Pyrinomonadaceae bacterium]
MSLTVTKAGVLTTFQDLGRAGFAAQGINPNGAMDVLSARLVNILLGNPENRAVLEMHFPAPELKFNQNALIAIEGADFSPSLDGAAISNGRPIPVKSGQILGFKKKLRGNRCYLAIKGGFKIEKWLESASTNLRAGIGGFKGRALRNGDLIVFGRECAEESGAATFFLSPFFSPLLFQNEKIRIIPGPEFEELTALSESLFLKEEFTVGLESDRMGYRLSGPGLFLLDELELVSAAAAFGTVQLLPDGQLIILMADHQTTGGYPRIGNVISADLPRLAQFGPKDRIKFETVSVQEAENLKIKMESDLNLLKFGLRERGF